MQIRRLRIERFRGIKELTFCPGPRTVIIGPNNAGKTTVLEALDVLLSSGRGRSRPPPTEIDYYARDPDAEFCIEAVLAQVPDDFATEAVGCFEGWDATAEEVRPEVEGDGLEPIVRVRVRGTKDLELRYEFAKEEAAGRVFGTAFRTKIAWIFDGRLRDPAYQLGFYQGGLLDRLFEQEDVSPAVRMLRQALSSGATTVNSDTVVARKLEEIADDLRDLGLITASEIPRFELGGISKRELLQSLRLALPDVGVSVPLARQGRGTQRLLLVALLLRLARDFGRPIIGGFEEPEEALEPMRQMHMAQTIADIAASGGQVFVVTHSPDIARTFAAQDFVLLDERSGGDTAMILRKRLDASTLAKYERWLDGSVVRGLFAKIPVLLEGNSDRAVFDVFWRAATRKEEAKQIARERIGLDFVNAEGAGNIRTLATVLSKSGKPVVAVMDGDRPEDLEALRNDGTCAVIVRYHDTDDERDLERLIAGSASINALTKALVAVAADRGEPWTRQLACIVSSLREAQDTAIRDQVKAATSLSHAFAALPEQRARKLIAELLGSDSSRAPFSTKTARPARILAEIIIDVDGAVPTPFARAIRELGEWAIHRPAATTEIVLRLSQ